MALPPMPDFLVVSGSQIEPHVRELASLRIQVFREYPYLYDGTEHSEAEYLQTYTRSPRAMVALAFEEGRMVGASTGLPMADEVAEFRQPFEDSGIKTEHFFYGGETVLLPEFRGRGLYRQFLTAREDYARDIGSEMICFCAVRRDEGDARRPEGYQPLDEVWKHFGYQPQSDLVAHFPWKEVGGTQEISHSLMFWTKPLN